VGTFLRLMLAFAALGAAATHIFKPELRIDVNTFALIAVAILLLFARGIRIKALDLMGVKVEFDNKDISNTQSANGTHPPPARETLQAPVADNYATRMSKLTPVEILTPYAIMMKLVENAFVSNMMTIITLEWGVFFVFFFLTPFYYLRTLRGPLGIDTQAIWQTVFLLVNFCGWALLLGGPFNSIYLYNPIYGAILLTLGAFALPAVTFATPAPKS
jgi:hypothetical protein